MSPNTHSRAEQMDGSVDGWMDEWMVADGWIKFSVSPNIFQKWEGHDVNPEANERKINVTIIKLIE